MNQPQKSDNENEHDDGTGRWTQKCSGEICSNEFIDQWNGSSTDTSQIQGYRQNEKKY